MRTGVTGTFHFDSPKESAGTLQVDSVRDDFAKESNRNVPVDSFCVSCRIDVANPENDILLTRKQSVL